MTEKPRVCVLSDYSLREFNPAVYFDGYTWEMVIPKNPLVDFFQKLHATDKYDVYLNLCDGSDDRRHRYEGLDVVRALEEAHFPFTGANSAGYHPTREEMQAAAERCQIGFARGGHVTGVPEAEALSQSLTVNSSGGIQLTDRSINNSRFSIDRDLGLHFANLNEKKDKFSYNFKGAITLGEGRNWNSNNSNSILKDNNGLCYTGKVELLPLGTFKKDGHYFEGDILREPKPKLMLSGSYSFNAKARKTQGQLGDYLYETRDLSSLLLDAIAKYNGWAFMASYNTRDTKNPVTINPSDITKTATVFTGNGTDLQLSYCFPSKYELIGRYSNQNVASDSKMIYPDINQYSCGVAKYIWEHALKLQTEFTTEKQYFYNNTEKSNWYLRFEIEIGI